MLDLSSLDPLYLPARSPSTPASHTARKNRPKSAEPSAVPKKLTSDSRLNIASNLPLPDNTRQTILQPLSLPELRIPFELRLPNVVVWNTFPKPPVEPPTRKMPSKQPGEQEQVDRTQEFVPTPPPPPDLASLLPSFTVPLTPPTLTLPRRTLPEEFSLLPLATAPPPPERRMAKGDGSNGIAKPQGFDLPWSAKLDTQNLLALSLDPSVVEGPVTLPLGTRRGVFSLLSKWASEDAAAISINGVSRNGTGGSATSGVEGDGVGTGESGNAVGAQGPDGNIGITITGGGQSLNGAASGLIYPVPLTPTPGLRRNGIVVATGPRGGGGLRVYGVLRGGRIYTIYLPMPGKNWILQYCHHNNPSPTETTRSTRMTVRFGRGLVPPHPEEKFDFHRPNIPKGKGNEMIILRGVIGKDGSVSALQVLQGLNAEIDRAALAAFGRWRFQPALRAGKRVSVEILLGIPARRPQREGVQTAKGMEGLPEE